MTRRPVLGIDLGTTYSCVASLDENQRVSVLPNQENELTTPSVVFFEESGNVTVGKFAKNELRSEPGRVVSLIKRHMGEDGYTVDIDGKRFFPQQVSAIILKQVVEDALGVLGVDPPADGPMADVVITVPAYFGAAERQATRDAGEMAGLEVLNIINEPTAAAIAYGLTSATATERSVLVYDLGGGTFDVTIIKVSKDEIRVVATGGNHQLGGADWDTRVVELICEKFTEQHAGSDPRTDLDASGTIELLAEEAKKALSRRDAYPTTVTANGERAKIELTRAEYESATADLIGNTLDFTRDVLGKAREKGVDHIDDLLLVGGMSHSPAVKEALVREFPDLPTPQLADPDQIVAKGAALFAASSVAEKDGSGSDGSGTSSPRGLPGGTALPKIVNVTSKGYGIAVVRDPKKPDGDLVVAWLIHPNDEIPARPSDVFRTVSDNQTGVDVAVYESTTDVLSEELYDNLELVKGTLKDIPRAPAGQPFDVSFNLEADGILHVKAVASNGRELKLEAKISGLVPEEVKRAPLPAIQR
ncbi:Hsp70 family protein [Saccharothrix violaceirubra]|uniref:Molecular chaperone DnaK n=1 Tax=Saccharothrix violaceirubra TaxID=413306 RepID=A0A7W7TAC6_9PSEU|nr:Hsp70 family protein [Saccharothrix violaceirubra]MBB4968160.1 molecular chaperone DnaK [Saccharothrix violaceirubra]